MEVPRLEIVIFEIIQLENLYSKLNYATAPEFMAVDAFLLALVHREPCLVDALCRSREITAKTEPFLYLTTA